MSRNRRGETLTETLVAMLIIGLSSVLFITMVGASGKIFRSAEERYNDIYEKIGDADAHNSAGSFSGTVTVKGSGTSETTVGVNWYGDTDYVLSYRVG